MKDLKTNKTTELKIGESYHFFYEKEEEKSRFVVFFKKSTIDVSDISKEELHIFSENENIYIKRDNTEKAQIDILDLTGRLIKNLSTQMKLIKVKNIKTGIYIVRYKTNNNTESKKVFVK